MHAKLQENSSDSKGLVCGMWEQTQVSGQDRKEKCGLVLFGVTKIGQLLTRSKAFQF